MTAAFIEPNPFHAETLYFLHATHQTGARDIVFGHRRLFGQEIFAAIPSERTEFTLRAFCSEIRQRRITTCYFNTINCVLYPLTREILATGLRTIVAIIVARLMGCQVIAILHEADQFLTSHGPCSRRNWWFRQLIGRNLLRLVKTTYVLSPEVLAYLTSRGFAVQLLDSAALSDLPPNTPEVEPEDAITDLGGKPEVESEASLAWVGPVSAYRRNWQVILGEGTGKGSLLSEFKVRMLCDLDAADGPNFVAAVRARGQYDRLTVCTGRPSDFQLLAGVRRSQAVLCLYGNAEYGHTKTSGARILAQAYRKPYLTFDGQWQLCGPDGEVLLRSKELVPIRENLFRRRESCQVSRAD